MSGKAHRLAPHGASAPCRQFNHAPLTAVIANILLHAWMSVRWLNVN